MKTTITKQTTEVVLKNAKNEVFATARILAEDSTISITYNCISDPGSESYLDWDDGGFPETVKELEEFVAGAQQLLAEVKALVATQKPKSAKGKKKK